MKVSTVLSYAIISLAVVISTTLFAADAPSDKTVPRKTPAKANLNKIDSNEIIKPTVDENAGNIAAPFIPGGTSVSAPIKGLDQLKDATEGSAAAGSKKGRGQGKGGQLGSSSGG